MLVRKDLNVSFDSVRAISTARPSRSQKLTDRVELKAVAPI